MKVRAGEAAHPVIRDGWRRCPRGSRTGGHPLSELLGKRGERSSSTPSARRPFQVNATVTHRASSASDASAAAAEWIFSRSADSQRPPAGPLPKRHELVASGERGDTRQQNVLDVVEFERVGSHHCISSSMAREARLQPKRLLDFVGGHVRVLAVLQEAGALVLADELDERRRVRLPVLREAIELLEDGVDARPEVNSATASSRYLSKSVSKMP